jgi:Putative zinc-finger
MNCRRVQQLLSKQLDGSLSQRQAAAITTHLENCSACHRRRDAFRALGADGPEMARLLVPPEIEYRTIEHRAVERWRVERETAARPSYRRLTPSGAVAAAITLIAALGLGLAQWNHRGNGSRKSVIAERQYDAGSPGKLAPPATQSRPSGRRAPEARSAPRLSVDHPSQKAKLPRMAQSSASGPSRLHLPGDDLAHANRDPKPAMEPWVTVPQDDWDRIEARVHGSVRGGDDFVRIPFPRIASSSDRQMAGAVESYQREAAIVDPRLSRGVTVQQKATALSDLCEWLRADTGIQLAAGSSVADEKVTLFCEKLPLRDVMRQLSRPFGYTWLRSGKTGEYKYELVQDLRSQLLEEELRNRDRNEALLSLEREIDRYRPYLDLSPDEALARTKTGARGGLSREQPAEKPLLEKLASFGWGPMHMYFRLSRNDLAALRSGQELTFSGAPDPGQQPLPPDLARGVFQSYRGHRVYKERDLSLFSSEDPPRPDSVPLAAVPEVRARIILTMPQSELGQFSLEGSSGIFFPRAAGTSNGLGPLAVGRSPAVLKPDNQKANAKYATDAVLRPRAVVQPQPSCRPAPVASTGDGSPPEPRVTTADVLEALHRATGLPIVADYYTRLYKPSTVSARNQALFGALNQLADAMGLRWNKEGSWLQFRSASYYDDRLKEVPNRLLEHWAALRRKQAALSLDDLIEIAQLPDAQLDGAEMAEGARECFGLAEWDLARSERLRPRLRFLASFTPAQRHDVVTSEGLPFTRMSLAQQQQFITEATLYDPLSLEELTGASMRVDYSQPGEFQWGNPDIDWHWSRWVIILEHGTRQSTRSARSGRRLNPNLRYPWRRRSFPRG